MIIRAALDQAVQRQLVVRNVAHHANARRRPASTGPARIWNAAELSAFLHAARHHRLYPALHLAAHTGLRRGELAGLRWSDLDEQTGRLSVCRTLQTFAGRTVEFGVKTRTSRRTVDLDQNTIDVLNRWRDRLRHDGLANGPDEAMFPNAQGQPLIRNPSASSSTASSGGQGCRASASTTCATPTPRFSSPPGCRSKWSPSGWATPIRPSPFTYQHLLPGMGAAAAEQFATLVGSPSR